ncbi:hypothetical protein ABEB36_004814 [Hypothenemus hampei]|uniref:FXNA-like protease n=1 Tax=Hypothenemus hampei TaxID=57062 RepID=A0ABD1EVW9_HYPHA
MQDSKPERTNIHSIPFYTAILTVCVLLGLFAIVYVVDNQLPVPLYVHDEANNPNRFIAERASWDVYNLSNIGPRVVGSYENEFITADYLTRRIDEIIQGANNTQYFEKDIQFVTGSYYLNREQFIINSYDMVQNIIVRLRGVDGRKSILINSHFDSVPTSPGASDDGINVAVMLEVLRIFANSNVRPLHNITFLFNGAEETPLQASHGFITKHEWAKGCQVVLNLDSCGSGGKIILFQSGPEAAWLLKYYSGVPHPYGQVAGEELFQTGILPSDTDFRIFRDFGQLVGLDMAFFKNNYRYHTKFDHYSFIPLGSYQHVGDNVLYLVQELSNAPELVSPEPSQGKAVYFDFLGLFMISYTNFTGCIINVLTVALSLVVFLYSIFSFKLGFTKSILKYLGFITLSILASWILCFLFAFIFATITDLLGKTMSWFGHPWMLFGLYVIPATALSGILLIYTNHENISLNVRCQLQVHMARLLFTIVLALGVTFNVRSSYALMVPILFSSLAFLTIHLLHLQHSVKKWQIVYVIFLILPVMLLMYQTLTTLTLLIPMSGMIGSSKNPDLLIGGLTVFFTILIVSPLTSMLNCIRNIKYFLIFAIGIFTVFVIMMFTPFGFPYSGNIEYPTTQRQWILHTSRKFHNESGNVVKMDAGFFFLNLDRNSPRILKGHVKDLDRAVSIQEDCDKYTACGLPLSHYKMLGIVKYSTWVPAGQPVLPQPVNLRTIVESVNSRELLYNISVTGPDRMNFYLVLKEDVSLLNISLANEIQPTTTTIENRPMYFILHQSTKEVTQFNFSMKLLVPENHVKGEATMNFTIAARYVHPKRMTKTPQFLELIEQMPDWTNVVAWLGTNYAYII